MMSLGIWARGCSAAPLAENDDSPERSLTLDDKALLSTWCAVGVLLFLIAIITPVCMTLRGVGQ